MNTIRRKAFSIYVIVVFALTFGVLVVPFMIIIHNKRWHKYTALLNRCWTRMLFGLALMPIEIEYKSKLDKRTNYVFCPNHFSYLDIPSMGLTPTDYIFVGKSAMERVPVFGYMYRKLHITVNRESLRSKHSTYVRSKEALENNRSLVIFPEGGILTDNPPEMARFKNGAFKVAIEKQIAIIPVTIPYNWIILPDDGRLLLRRKKVKVIYHEPIETKGLTLDDLPVLRTKVFGVIDTELKSEVYANQQADFRKYSTPGTT